MTVALRSSIAKKARAGAPRPTRDAERTRGAILDAATAEFARHGLGGARVDRIAERAKTNKRMLYYYFGGKEALFLAVLERAYEHIRNEEQGLHLTDLAPVQFKELNTPVAGELRKFGHACHHAGLPAARARLGQKIN